jgi:hypothetical protein
MRPGRCAYVMHILADRQLSGQPHPSRSLPHLRMRYAPQEALDNMANESDRTDFSVSAQKRQALIRRIEDIRGSSVICYLTSFRQNAGGQIAEDAVRVFFDHLLKLPSRPVAKLDVFLCSNGGASTVPWRLVSLFREFAQSFNVLIPYRAYSAATLIALGADEIVMHPFGELGPIDPSVSNEFNPTDPGGRRLAISVEDVKAYINFVKTTVGITHEDELVKTVEILANKVHPLALGNVERFLSQSRMMAKKILRTHMAAEDQHAISEIVETMASKLFFHGHPINRREAKEDLKLKVLSELTPELETAMWDLYLLYEDEFKNGEVFNPLGNLLALPDEQCAQIGIAPNGQPIRLPRIETDTVHAMVESGRLSSRHSSRHRYTLFPTPAPHEKIIGDDVLAQGWSHSSARTEPESAAPSDQSPAGVQVGGKARPGRKGTKSRPVPASN